MDLSNHLDHREVGRSLGHDLYRFRSSFEVRDVPPSIVEGFTHARIQHVAQRAPDRYVRKWLQLRLNAYRRNRVVDERVTPEFLRRIDIAVCPVMRIALTHGERKPSDWSIDRLNNDGAYAPNNLAVISTQANKAKGNRSFEEVYALSRCERATDELTPAEWLRLAALMLGPCFATAPRLAPMIPLVAPIPDYSVRTAAQLIQHVFTVLATSQSGKNALIKHFKPVCRDEYACNRLHRFADAMHEGLKGVEPRWDVWEKPKTMEAFLTWRALLNAQSWALAGEIARRLADAHPVEQSRLESWRLSSGGYFH